MKVKDLIAQLNKLDPNLDVYCYEDGSVSIEGGNPGPFDIVGVTAEMATASRHSETRKPILKFEGAVPGAYPRAIIGITPDF